MKSKVQFTKPQITDIDIIITSAQEYLEIWFPILVLVQYRDY